VTVAPESVRSASAETPLSEPLVYTGTPTPTRVRNV